MLALAVEVVLVVDDGVAEGRIGGIPPLLEATQQAVLRAAPLLVLVVGAEHVVEALALVRGQAEFLGEGLVAVTAHGRGHRPRVVVVERGEPAVLRVEAGVLAGDVALVVVVRGARGQGREAEVDVGLEAGQVDVARGRLELDRTDFEIAVGHAVAVLAEAGRAAAAELVGLGHVAQGQVEAVARTPEQRGTAIGLLDEVGVLLAAVDRAVVERAVRGERRTVAVEHVDLAVVGDAREVVDRGVQAQGQGIGQREVEGGRTGAADAVGMVDARSAQAYPAAEGIEFGFAQDEAHRAAERARTVQRALRAAQHFDALDVGEQEVGEQRRLVDIGGHGRGGRHRVVAERRAVDV